MKKCFLLIAAFLFISGLQAQTKRIAHLSHSGAVDELDFTLGDNFGVVYMPFVVDSFVRLDSSRVISIIQNAESQTEIWRDTLVNPPHINDPLRFMDSVRREPLERRELQRLERISFSGFGTDAETAVVPSPAVCSIPQSLPQEVLPLIQEPEAPEGSHRQLGWFLAGGGILLAFAIWMLAKGKN